MMRHRDAWAEQQKAPTLAAHLAELEEEKKLAEKPGASEAPLKIGEEMALSNDESADAFDEGSLPKEILIVASKLKKYVKARSGFNTSDGVMDVLSDELRRICVESIKNAARDGRKTVLDRDVKKALGSG